MARPSKPLELQSKHLTKEEIDIRSKVEKMLKTSSDKVYKVPSKLNKIAKKIYKNIVDKLKPLDILSDLDIDSVTIVSNALHQMDIAINDINEKGQVIYIKNDMGDIIKAMKNPSVEVYKTFASLYDSVGGKLCMNPSARAKLSAEIAAVLREEEKEEIEKELTKEELEMKWLMGDIK